MIRNYFKIAWRNLIKNKGFSLINIGGLAVGMAVVLLISLWIFDEISFDKHHKNYQQISQVLVNKTANGITRTRYAMPYPLGNELRNKFGNDFKYVVMSSWPGDNILSIGDKNLTITGGFMENDALRMLSLKMLHGNWNGLNDPHSIVISQSTALAFFGNADPMGELMNLNNKMDVVVTGIYQDIPNNSKFNDLNFIAPWELYVTSTPWIKFARDNNLWDNNSYQVFTQISDGANMEKVSTKIINTIYNNVPEYTKASHPEIFLHPMKDWHLRSSWKNGFNTGGLIQYVWLFGIVGIFVLILACINFMNLSTAQSEKRAKEVGIRKSIGSSKGQLIAQFLSESFLVTSLAFVIAVFLVLLLLPSFNELADKQIAFPYKNTFFWITSLVFIFITGILAGSYPALYLSSFRPVKVLKGTFKAGKSATSFREVLVVTQFAVSIILIIGTIAVAQQIQYSKNRPIGYEKNELIMIGKNTEDYEGKYNQLRNELINKRAITEMAESSSPLTEVWSGAGGFEWEGKDPNFQTNMVNISITHDFGKTVGWELLEGRDFSREFSTDSTAFVLNKTAVKYMGLTDPIGKTIKWNGSNHKVIGVVKDLLMESPFESVKPTVYLIKYDNTNWIELKLNPNKSVEASLALIKTTFNNHVPNVPFEYQFVDEEFATKFKAEERIRKLSTIFAFLAILISCMGLFGLASFMAEQRTKEVGIRKVLGSSVFNLWKLLSKDFIKLVLISCMIAIPLAYYGVVNWFLNNYEYHTNISWWTYAFVGLGALAITLITVSFQAIKTSMLNPIQSLKTE